MPVTLRRGSKQRNRLDPTKIETRCPSCNHQSLFVSPNGHLTCSWLGCPEPGVEFAFNKLKSWDVLFDRIQNLPKHRVEFPGFALSDPPFRYDAVLLKDVDTLRGPA